MRILGTVGAALCAAALVISSPAAAAVSYFNLSGDATLTFSIDDSVSPDAWDSSSFSYFSVATVYNGNPQNDSLSFYTTGLGGGFSDGFFLDLYGAQLFSGATGSPTFILGTYALTNAFAQGNYSLTISDVAGVPEPATWAMMLLGFGAIGGALRFGRRKQAVFTVHA